RDAGDSAALRLPLRLHLATRYGATRRRSVVAAAHQGRGSGAAVAVPPAGARRARRLGLGRPHPVAFPGGGLMRAPQPHSGAAADSNMRVAKNTARPAGSGWGWRLVVLAVGIGAGMVAAAMAELGTNWLVYLAAGLAVAAAMPYAKRRAGGLNRALTIVFFF